MTYKRIVSKMNDFDSVLKQLAENEVRCGCGACVVDGIPVWDALRYKLRIRYLRKLGFDYLDPGFPVRIGGLLRSVVKSFFQLCRTRGSYECIFFSFPRVDRISGKYLDKFTDPIIEAAGIKSYLILERGRGGVHSTPRLHQDRLVYLELLVILAKIDALFAFRLRKRHKSELARLSASIRQAYGEILSEKEIEKNAVDAICYVRRLASFLRKVNGKCVIGPSRAYQAFPFLAARAAGMKTIELQHGITYGETVMYSGYQSPGIVPDWFCEFGDNRPRDVYGIRPERMVNIGWALFDYLKTIPAELTVKEKDVLVVSEPVPSVELLNAVCVLARENRESCFYFRPHPNEHLTADQIRLIENEPNVVVQDNGINIAVALQSFSYIIGENSTVLYEALSMGKIVGRLFFEGLSPRYLTEDDKALFWEISDKESFELFMSAGCIKGQKSIYSPFDREAFMHIICN